MALFTKSKRKLKRPSPAATTAPPKGAGHGAARSPPDNGPNLTAAAHGTFTGQHQLVTHQPRPPFPPYQSSPTNPGWADSNLPPLPPLLPAGSPPCLPPRSSPQPKLVRANDSTWTSLTNLATSLGAPTYSSGSGCGNWTGKGFEGGRQGVELCHLIGSKLDSVLTLIDGERFSGDERELVIFQTPSLDIRGGGSLGAQTLSRGVSHAVTNNPISANYFKKVNLYVNSRLPPYLPPLKLHLPTWPLLSLAAQYSHRVYSKPAGAERYFHVDADWRMGTKAMVIKSVPNDAMNTIVFAIRGTQTFMDWAVNLNSAPTSPVGFLDDCGNLCHSGFLSVARKMIKPVAARLRHMLEEEPSRASCSLLITGHSAGGAVASLLYAHMLAENAKSELNFLTRCFKRVHCITFGAPPVSLLPIQRPQSHRLHKSLFYSFINEGDPVPRADKAYVRSLLDLYTSPPPIYPAPNKSQASPATLPHKSLLRPFKKTNASAGQLVLGTDRPPNVTNNQDYWPVPPSTLSNAGRLVLLRTFPNFEPDHQRTRKGGNKPSPSSPNVIEQSVQAFAITDAQLRPVVFGDPLMHMMKRYAQRIETLATRAVLVKA